LARNATAAASARISAVMPKVSSSSAIALR
jgi:hypothetical protein